MTPKPSITILYVDNVAASCTFYSGVLERQPVDQSPNFGMFALEGGMMLGLWAKTDTQPKPLVAAGCAELGFSLEEKAQLDALHLEWARRGYSIIQKPVDMDFGYTFTAVDLDGHRLRVMVLA